MANPFDLAAGMVGKREGPDRAALQDYLRTGGANLDPATVAWCAAFVNSSLGQAGLKGTGSNLARSFLNYGSPVDQPQKGDIAVFKRGADPRFGHVGFFNSMNPDGTISVLGGNQSDSVKYSNFNTADLLGYRRPGAGGQGLGDVVAPKAGVPAPAPGAATQPAPMAGAAPMPSPFGDVVAPAAAPDFGSVVASFLQNRQRRQEDTEAEQIRRNALFAQVGSPFV